MFSSFRQLSLMAICLAVGLLTSLLADSATLTGPATWGNPNQAWGTRRAVTPADRAAVAKYRSGQTKPVFSTDFKDQASLSSQWLLQSDDYLKSCRRPENVLATNTGLQLQTRNASNCRAQWSSGSMISQFQQKFGFFEATIKTADINGLNNAFWIVTKDHLEIDIAEIHFPNILRLTLHDNNKIDDKLPPAVGFNSTFTDNFSQAYHDFGVLWTPTDIIFEVDGEPIAAISTKDAIKDAADIRFSTALMDYAGKIPANPAGHHMYVKSLRVYPL